MALKTSIINSNQASFRDSELMPILKYLCSEGVFNSELNDDDLKVVENPSGADMDVYANAGAALIEYTKIGVTWKVIVEGAAQQLAGTVAANATGSNRIDAVVISLAQTELNALKTNVAALEIVTGSGVSALSDGAITTALGHANWYRLADITVANGATSIANAVITDTRAPVTFGVSDGTYETPYAGAGAALSGIITNPFTASILPDTDVAYDFGSPTFQLDNIYAQYFHGDGSNLTNLSVGGFQAAYTLGEAYPINDFPFYVNETFGASRNAVTSVNRRGQIFTVPTGVTAISMVDICGELPSGADTDVITCAIYATSSSLPTGAALGSTTLFSLEVGDPSANTDFGTYANAEWTRFKFSSDITVTPGSVYAVVVYMSTYTTASYNWAYNSSSVVSGNGVHSTNSGSSWTSDASEDQAVRVFGKYSGGVYPFYLEDGRHTEFAILQSMDVSGYAGLYDEVYTTRQAGMAFRAHNIDVISKIKAYVEVQGAPAGATAVNFYIYACGSDGLPTGAALWSDTTNTVTTIGALALDLLTLSPALAITDGSIYALIMTMPATGDGTNNVYFYAGDTGNMPQGWVVNSSDGGATWSASRENDVAMTVYGYKSRTAGRVYRCDPGHPDRQKIEGWSIDTTAASAGDPITLKVDGAIENIATTLTPGYEYWLSMDGFTPASSPPTIPDSNTYWHATYAKGGQIWLGRASDTDILQTSDAPGWEYIGSALDQDQAYTTADTSYIQVPKDARYAVVKIVQTASYPKYLEMTLDKYGKSSGILGASGSGTTYTVSVSWDTTNNRLAVTCAGATRSYTYAYFYR